MTTNPCLICGSTLTLREGRAFCSNDSCPSGGLFLRCGYCRSFSFSIHPEQMACANRECRMHDVKRIFCQTCSKTSRIEFAGEEICINRNCSSNKEVISTCFFCGKRAFLKVPGIMICTKGDCPYILEPMETCFHCGEVAFDLKEGHCRNGDCDYHGTRLERCPSCDGLTRVVEEDHPHLESCTDPDCMLFYGVRSPPEPEKEPVAALNEADATQSYTKEDREKILATETELDAAPVGRKKEPAAPAPPPPKDPGAFPVRHHDDDFSVPLPKALLKPAEPPTRVSPSGRLVAATPPSPTPAEPPEVEAPAEEPPAPDSPPRGAPAPAAPAGRGGDATAAVFRFFRDRVLMDKSGVTPSLYPVIGLSGAGKTTYLSMLGDILAHRGARYHFPWKGVAVRRVEVEKLLEELGDDASGAPDPAVLAARVRDLAYDFASHNISSFVAKGQWSEPSRDPRFLVSRLARRGKLIAQIVSVEAGGKEYDETLRGLRARVGGTEKGDAVEEAMVEILADADGIVILLDPANEENGEAYIDFFRLLAESAAPRAIERFRKEVNRRLGTQVRRESKAGQLEEIIADLLREEAGEEVTKTVSRSGDETMVVKGGSPQLRRKVSDAIKEVRSDFSLDPALALRAEASPMTKGSDGPFHTLRHVAVVVTKSDMYPTISPPDNYPDQKLPKCKPTIAALDGYLRLCGGGVRFYNASATGYSILKDTLHYPGKENTLTPINVAEPIFDMIDSR